MKHLLAIMLVASLVVGTTAKAAIVQTITMKDGSVYKGYVKNSNAGKGTLMFHCEEAVVNVSQEKASTVSKAEYDWTSLPREWRDKLKKAPNAAELKSQKICIGSVARHSNVRILEDGVVIRYQTITPEDLSLVAKDVARIEGHRRPSNLISGIDREYFLKGSISKKGQYAGETDSTVSVFLANGLRETFRRSDIQKVVYSKVNPAQTTLEQSELADVITLKAGGSCRGVVVEQNYSNKNASDNYFCIEDEYGNKRVIKLSDIQSQEKDQNKAYKPVFDVILREGETVVNRNPVYSPIKIRENEAQQLVVDTLGTALTVSGDSTIVVEFNDPKSAGVEKFKLVKLTEMKVKKLTVNCFTYKDLAESDRYRTNVPPTTSVNGTTRVEYKASNPGYYVLYDGKSSEGYLLKIEKK